MVNGVITQLSILSLLVQGKSTHTHTVGHYLTQASYISFIINTLHIQYLPYNHPLVLELGQAAHSDITVIHLSTCTLACAIMLLISLQYVHKKTCKL